MRRGRRRRAASPPTSTSTRSSRAARAGGAARSTPATASCPRTPRSRAPCADAGPRLRRPAAGGDRADGRQGARQARPRGRRAGRARRAGDDLDVDALRARPSDGYPVLVKAVAGGGGKGMRVVRARRGARRPRSPPRGARRRPRSATTRAPRALPRRAAPHRGPGARRPPRRVVHLGERECSLQRRHQKVVEEAPSPVVDAALRARMGEAAVALAARARLRRTPARSSSSSPATAASFYFLEMNTRLQVEHPVTELVTGVDLVAQQLRVAAGEPLGAAPGRRRARAATRSRRGSTPRTRPPASCPRPGTVAATARPRARRARRRRRRERRPRSARDYDPLLAKVDRPRRRPREALRRLDRALAELELLGVDDQRRASPRAARAATTSAPASRTPGCSSACWPTLPPRRRTTCSPAAARRRLPARHGRPTPPGPWRPALREHGEVRVATAR